MSSPAETFSLRLSLNETGAQRLRDLMEATKSKVPLEVVNNAILTYEALIKAKNAGNTVLIAHPDGAISDFPIQGLS
jgi:hypothetical protein